MQTLLENIAIGKDEKATEEDKSEANLAVTKAQTAYGLSVEEIGSLSEDGESIERVQAILIKEHNDVSGASSPLTTIQIIKHMRAMLQKDEKGRGQDDDEGLLMSDVRKLQLLEFTGYKSTKLYQIIKFAMLVDDNYAQLMKIHDYHCEYRLQGQPKKKKSTGNSSEEEGVKQMEFHGLEMLVANVDEEAIKDVFEEIIEGKRSLASVKEFTTKWVRSNSKCFFCFTSEWWCCFFI